jgi:fermentation-respiration switch protein FrsA (DUF1100 family)
MALCTFDFSGCGNA